MADIVAQEVGAQACPQVYLWAGGTFDLLLAGLPLYFWIIFLGALAFGGVLFWNWYVWNQITPVAGYWDALRRNIPQALKISKNMRMKLVPIKYADQIFEDEDPSEIEKWRLTSFESVGQLGSVNTSILCDIHGWTDNPIYNESIKIASEMWNRLHPEDQIHHFTKYAEYRENGKLKAAINKMNEIWHNENPNEPMPMEDVIRIPSYFYVSFTAQEQYMPRLEDPAAIGGWMIHESSDYKTPENEEKKNYGAWILGGSVALSIIMIIFAFLYSTAMLPK